MKKEVRKAKVYSIYQNGSYKSQIRLQGKWLEELGFNIGDGLKIDCKEGQIIISCETNSDELKN